MRCAHVLLVPTLILMQAGCASSGDGGADQRPSRQGNVITAAEFEQTQFRDAHDIIRALRPNWLAGGRAPSIGTAAPVIVYVDGIRVGGVDFLRQVAAADMDSARWLAGPEATSRFGTGHAGGAILVTTRRQ
jgi:hypothetical protein